MPTYPVYASSKKQAEKDIISWFKHRSNPTDIKVTEIKTIRTKLSKVNGELTLSAKHYKATFEFAKKE